MTSPAPSAPAAPETAPAEIQITTPPDSTSGQWELSIGGSRTQHNEFWALVDHLAEILAPLIEPEP